MFTEQKLHCFHYVNKHHHVSGVTPVEWKPDANVPVSERLLSRGGGFFLCFNDLLALKQVTQKGFSGVCLLLMMDVI